mmetsp:Transcript_51751/g.166892  ORF Transcript_51751/g.166892 Transcript_51751/m.166892 type:complete len:384 (-) Transcript_51751:43-1194(-)
MLAALAVAAYQPPCLARSSGLQSTTLRRAVAPVANIIDPNEPSSEVRRAGPADAPEQRIDSEETYRIMFRTLMETENKVADEVAKNYALFDYGFMQRLEEAKAQAAPGSDEAGRIEEVDVALKSEMARRMGEAAEALKSVLTSPSAVVMEGRMTGLARQGKLDDALLQLLEANLQRASEAGEAGKGAVAALSKLKQRVMEELDKKVPPDMALVRQLLRMESKPARLQLLKEKMTPKQRTSLVMATSVEDAARNDLEAADNDGEPDVDSRRLAQAFKEIKGRFGNVDEEYDTGFVERLEMISLEAEEVALEIAGGEEVTARQQQDMMWDRGTVSVWQLEEVENKAHEEGKLAVWEKEAQDQMSRDMEDRMKSLKGDDGNGGLLS